MSGHKISCLSVLLSAFGLRLVGWFGCKENISFGDNEFGVTNYFSILCNIFIFVLIVFSV